MPSAKKLPPSVKIYSLEEVVSKDSIVKVVFAKKKFVLEGKKMKTALMIQIVMRGISAG